MGLAIPPHGWLHLCESRFPMARITPFQRNGNGLMTCAVYILLALLALAMSFIG